ncbi:MAG: hypothetical protein IKK87_07455, partial [Bacteroidaceae bacterium]|nr:hypothetical protein [Bacteroidaceae bacterium]
IFHYLIGATISPFLPPHHSCFHGRKQFFLHHTFYISSFGMYIPSFGMYIPRLGTYIPSLGI